MHTFDLLKKINGQVLKLNPIPTLATTFGNVHVKVHKKYFVKVFQKMFRLG